MSYDDKKPPFKDKKFGDKKFGDKKPFSKDSKFGDKKFGDKKFGKDDKNKSLDMHGSTPKPKPVKFDRIAKVMARAGLCSRRDAERWIEDERVSVNGRLLTTPAVKVSEKDIIKVDGKLIKAPEATRLWKYYKPSGLVTSHGDPEGRPTVFSRLRSEGLPRVVSVGRLDINTEGLLLITNNGSLSRYLEMPTTGWVRKYRARAYGKISQAKLDTLKGGVTVEGVRYGSILATLERQTGDNCWISLSLKEGKNREVKEVLGSLGLQVNRLIRLSYGPFKLENMERGTVEPITTQMLKDQLGDVFDEIDEGYDAELRPQDQVGYRDDSRATRGARDARSGGRDDRGGRGGRSDRGGRGGDDFKSRDTNRRDNRDEKPRRDSRGGRSFENDGDKSERRDDNRGSFGGEKRPGRNNERPSYNRDRKRSENSDSRSDRPRRSEERDDTRGRRNDGRNPNRSEYRSNDRSEGGNNRRDEGGNLSYGGKSAGLNKGKPGKSGTGHRERARGGKPSGNRSGAPRSGAPHSGGAPRSGAPRSGPRTRDR